MSRQVGVIRLLTLLALAGTAAHAAGVPVLQERHEFEVPELVDRSWVSVEAANGKVYNVVETAGSGGPVETAVAVYQPHQPGPSLTKLGYRSQFPPRMVVEPTGEAYVLGSSPDGANQRLFIHKVNADGSVAWMTKIGATFAPNAELVASPGAQVVVLMRDGPLRSLMRFNRLTGALRWRVDDTANPLFSVVANSSVAVVSSTVGTSPNRDLQLRGYRLTDGVLLWTRTHNLGGDEAYGFLTYNAVNDGIFARGSDTAFPARVFVARFKPTGELAWRRILTNVANNLALEVDATGALTHLYSNPSSWVVERIKDSGALVYSTPLPNSAGVSGDPLSLDALGNAYVANVVGNGNGELGAIRLTGITSAGAVAWQVDHGPPLVQEGFAMSGIAALPSGPFAGTFYVLYTEDPFYPNDPDPKDGTLIADWFGF